MAKCNQLTPLLFKGLNSNRIKRAKILHCRSR